MRRKKFSSRTPEIIEGFQQIDDRIFTLPLEITMHLLSILISLISIISVSFAGTNHIVGIWSEFGCEQDQIVIKSSGQITTRLWAGDEYGWLTQYRYWSSSDKTIEIRSRKYKNSEVVEEWTITERLEKELMVFRRTTDRDARSIRLISCE